MYALSISWTWKHQVDGHGTCVCDGRWHTTRQKGERGRQIDPRRRRHRVPPRLFPPIYAAPGATVGALPLQGSEEIARRTPFENKEKPAANSRRARWERKERDLVVRERLPTLGVEEAVNIVFACVGVVSRVH